jgi:DNA gyrase/topoisomerase IV subunit A
MRYTNVKLSKYGALFFDPYYMPVVDLVPNYDGSEEEPVVLPALLPNILMNGGEGMAVAVTCMLPTYTPQSVIKCVLAAATKDGATPAMCATLLEFNSVSHGVVHKAKQKAEVMAFYKTGQAGIIYDSVIAYNEKDKAFVLTGAAPWKGVDSRMNALLGVPDKLADVTGVDDQSEQWKLNIRYVLKRGVAGEALEAVKKKLTAMLSSKVHFKVNITERKLVEENGWRKSKSSFRPSTVPAIINEWLLWRNELEVKATKYHLAQLEKAMRRNELLRLAVQFRDFIFTLAKSTKTDEQVKAAIKAKLKCTQEEAEFIFDLKWRSLRSLEDKAIAAKLAEQAKQKREYEKRVKNPGAYVVENLQELAKLF